MSNQLWRIVKYTSLRPNDPMKPPITTTSSSLPEYTFPYFSLLENPGAHTSYSCLKFLEIKHAPRLFHIVFLTPSQYEVRLRSSGVRRTREVVYEAFVI